MHEVATSVVPVSVGFHPLFELLYLAEFTFPLVDLVGTLSRFESVQHFAVLNLNSLLLPNPHLAVQRVVVVEGLRVVLLR